MRQFESYALGEICICISHFENIRILPGINLIDDTTYDKLLKHPAFSEYLVSGLIEEIHIDQSDFVVDPDTQITIVETDDEKIPIQNIMINTKSEPLAKTGIFISPSMAKKAGLNQEIANRIGKFAPSTGWLSALQIKQKLDLSDEIDLSKLPFPEHVDNIIVTE